MPLSTCGPGTKIIHGQTATRRTGELSRYRTDRFERSSWREVAGGDLVNCFHGRGDALHVHTGGTGGNERDQSGGPFCGLKLQFTPAGNDRGAQPKTVAEPLSCS